VVVHGLLVDCTLQKMVCVHVHQVYRRQLCMTAAAKRFNPVIFAPWRLSCAAGVAFSKNVRSSTDNVCYIIPYPSYQTETNPKYFTLWVSAQCATQRFFFSVPCMHALRCRCGVEQERQQQHRQHRLHHTLPITPHFDNITLYLKGSTDRSKDSQEGLRNA
jgi:hypothetical protein